MMSKMMMAMLMLIWMLITTVLMTILMNNVKMIKRVQVCVGPVSGAFVHPSNLPGFQHKVFLLSFFRPHALKFFFETLHFQQQNSDFYLTFIALCGCANRCRKLVTPFQFASQTCETFQVTKHFHSARHTTRLHSVKDQKVFTQSHIFVFNQSDMQNSITQVSRAKHCNLSQTRVCNNFSPD